MLQNAVPVRTAVQFWALFQDVQRSIRAVAFCLTGMLTMIGVASATATLTLTLFGQLAGATLAFHIYAFLLNDLLDLPTDRLNPNRAHYPLVTGAFPVRWAWVVCLAQLPLAFALAAWAETSLTGYGALATAFLLITCYNLWGKTNSFPPVTDVTQGLGWGALAVFGAAATAQGPTLLTWWVVATITVAVAGMNGVHGSLRDIEADRASGRFTTAMLLGAQVKPDGTLSIPGVLRLYMLLLVLAVAGLFGYGMLANLFALSGGTWWVVVGLVAMLQWVAVGATVRLTWENDRHAIELLGYAYWHATLACFTLPFLFGADWSLRLAIAAVFFGPLLSYEWTYVFLAHWVRRFRRRWREQT